MLLKKGAASKKELSFEMGLSQAALTISARPLIENGVIQIEGKKGNGKAGRKEEMLSLNPNYGYYLGCDIKETSITVSTMDFAGHLTFEKKCRTGDEAILVIETLIKDGAPLGVGAIHRKSKASEKASEFIARLSALPIPAPRKVNNVESLAAIYRFYHEEATNFLLIKYGPGVGSCIYANGAPILRSNGVKSEIGHAFLSDGRRLEDAVSFSSLLHEDIEEREGAELIYRDEKLLNAALQGLALAIVDADALLALDKIVFAGILLSKEDIKEKIGKMVLAYDPSFDVSKISIYPDYEEKNREKACLEVMLEDYN
ncbi:MAG: hypothetical protein K6F32_02035 [Bacilli bacterium]|nr:hypothetical protein [Bacilli bacterium]